MKKLPIPNNARAIDDSEADFNARWLAKNMEEIYQQVRKDFPDSTFDRHVEIAAQAVVFKCREVLELGPPDEIHTLKAIRFGI